MAQEDANFYEQAIDAYEKAIEYSKNTDG